jgi:hypothetical protein
MPSWKDIHKQHKKAPKVNPAFVAQHLESVPHKKGSSSWFVACPFHGETRPSLSVIIDPSHRMSVGFWKCFGCGKMGRWNDLAKALRLPTFDDPEGDFIDDEELIELAMSEDLEDDVSVKKLRISKNKFIDIDKLAPWPVDRKWRGFSGKLVRKWGGNIYRLDYHYPLIFPCAKRNSQSDIIGAIRCRMKSSKKYPSYLFTVGTWTSNYLFPEEKLKGPIKTLVLVEGVRDTKAMLYRNIPTLGLSGTQSGMSSSRKNTLLGLGVERVIVFFDGDEPDDEGLIAAEEGAKKVAKALRKDFDVKVFPTWKKYPGKDPYTLAKDDKFIRYFKIWSLAF